MKFATYTRDSATLLDYADQRYYGNVQGRFMTPDPAMRSANPKNPQTWNRYAYVAGDPVNHNDPKGLCSVAEDGTTMMDTDIGYTYLYDGECQSVGDDGLDDEAEAESAASDQLLAMTQAVDNENPQGFLNSFLGLSVSAGVGAAGGIASYGAFMYNGITVSGYTVAEFSGIVGADLAMLGSGPITNEATGAVYSGYVELGGVLNAQTLNVPTDIWNALGPEGQDQAMSSFIDAVLNRGADIVFTSNPALAPAGSGTAFEFQYITGVLGLQIVQQGTSWVVVAK